LSSSALATQLKMAPIKVVLTHPR